MDRKSSPSLLASPAASEGVPYVPGAILRQQVGPSIPETSPAAAEPLPAALWPPVDEYLDEPDEANRWERIDGVRKWASPAKSGHGDPHFKLNALLDAHMAEGYIGSLLAF